MVYQSAEQRQLDLLDFLVDISSCHTTDLGSRWAIPKLQSSTCEVILLLIWMYAVDHCHAERLSPSFSTAFLAEA